jgi:ribosome recycling factor
MFDGQKEFQEEVRRATDTFKREISGVRTNRPTASLIEEIKANYYDAPTPLKHLGSIGVTLPREIHMQVWDTAALPAIAKAIETSSVGLVPQVDGNIIRVFLPELSEERREEFKKHIKKTAEEFRIQIRHSRDDMMKKIEKAEEAGEITEDEKFRERETAQKTVESGNAEIERILDAKIKEIDE